VRSQRLPTAQALLSPQSQRLDDLSDRLRRALVHRTEIAAGCSPAMAARCVRPC
jgi:exodeoxyribonuclease VII large subunit